MQSTITFAPLRKSRGLTRRLVSAGLAFLVLAQTLSQAAYAAVYIPSNTELATRLQLNPEYQRAATSNQLYQQADYLGAPAPIGAVNLQSFYARLLSEKLALPQPQWVPIAGAITVFVPTYPIGKLVGDDFVQNRMLRDQVHSLLGRHIINPAKYTGDNRLQEILQTNELYENAHNFALVNRNLIKFGTPLPASQTITADMIWPEYRVIENQTVLVPVLYLTDATIEQQKVQGSVNEFNRNVTFGNITINNASLVARRDAFITATQNIEVNSGGSLTSLDNLDIVAGNTFSNLSGYVSSGKNVTILAKEIFIKTQVIPFIDKNGSGTRLGAIASVNSTNGNIVLGSSVNPANNITIAGATINAKGGGISMNAAGNIIIAGVNTGYTYNEYSAGDMRINQSNLDVFQSRIGAQDTIKLIAGGVIQISASDLVSTQGGIELLATQGIYVLDEVNQEQIQKVDRKGKTTGQSSEFRTEAVRSVLQAGKGILLDSAHGDVVLKAAKVSSTDGTQVYARDGKVRMLMTKELEEFHLQSVKKGTWTIKTRTEDVVNETNIQNAIVGGFQVQATKGIDVEYTGKPGATLQEQIEEFRQMPEMKWMADLYDQALTQAGPDLKWSELEEIHKELKKTNKSLSPAAMALIAIAVCVAMGPAGAGWIGASGGGAIGGAVGGGTLGAALNAGALTLATQATQSLAATNSPSATLKAMGSSDSLKSLAVSMVTAGALQNTDLKMFDAVKADSMGLSLGKQAGQAVYNSAVSAGISVAINGGDSQDFLNSFKQGLLTSAADKLGEKMAKRIGDAYQNGSPEGISNSLRYIAHAGAGCVYGIASAAATQSNNNEKYSCFSGAGGAVIGELVADQFKDHHEIAARQKATEDWLALNGIDANTQGLTPDQLKLMKQTMPANFISQAELRNLQAQGVDLAKLGAGLAAFVANGDVNIAASAGKIAAENNALPLVIYGGMLALSAVSLYLMVQDTIEFGEKLSDPSISEDEKQKLVIAYAKSMGVDIALTVAGVGAIRGAKALFTILRREGKVSENVVEELDRVEEAVDSGKKYEADAGKSLTSAAKGEPPTLPAGMSQPEFGKLTGWGVGPEDAAAKVAAGYTDAEIQMLKNAGVTKDNIQSWLSRYQALAKIAADKGNPNVGTPTSRAILMQKILEKW